MENDRKGFVMRLLGIPEIFRRRANYNDRVLEIGVEGAYISRMPSDAIEGTRVREDDMGLVNHTLRANAAIFDQATHRAVGQRMWAIEYINNADGRQTARIVF